MERAFESMSNVKDGICYNVENNKVVGEVTNRRNEDSCSRNV